nr:histidine kinase [uncultured Eisenbergiella sp.]
MTNRLNWKIKLVITIIGAVSLVVVILYLVTYLFFSSQLRRNDEKIAQINFRQAEENLEEIIKLGIRDANRYDMDMLAWNFGNGDYADDAGRTSLNRKMILRFEEILAINPNLSSVAQMNGNGQTVISTVNKNRSGMTMIPEEFREILQRSTQSYPAFQWVSGDILGDTEILCKAVEEPAILGIRSIGKSDSSEEDSYIVLGISEERIRRCYESVVYNGSSAMLLDEEGKIISSTREGLLYRTFEQEKDCQIVVYPLSYNNWTLVNMIPVKNYQRDIRTFRNFSLAIILTAALCVIFIGVKWSRRYTAPIQSLMDNMEKVGKEQLDIALPEKTGLSELDNLNQEFCHTVRRLKTYIADLQQAEKDKAAEEIKALQYQINPHFLYNSLNSIRWMAMMTNNGKIADSIVMLTKIITPVFRNPSLTWKIRDELAFLDNYIGMMMLRYAGNLQYRMECGEELYEEVFPRFVLQPVIENCFVHCRSKTDGMEIRVRIRKENGGYRIEVRNTADQVDEERLAQVNEQLRSRRESGKEDVGLINVVKRLSYLYGEHSSVMLRAEGKEVVGEIVFSA